MFDILNNFIVARIIIDMTDTHKHTRKKIEENKADTI